MSAADSSTADFLGALSFQSPLVERSLSATGSVYAIVDSTTGGFSATIGNDPVTLPTPIYNGRATPPGHLALDTAGFQLIEHKLPAGIDFWDERQVLTAYYAEVCRAVQTATGAYKVYAFDHVLRQTNVSKNAATSASQPVSCCTGLRIGFVCAPLRPSGLRCIESTQRRALTRRSIQPHLSSTLVTLPA